MENKNNVNKMDEIILASVNTYNQGTVDKNGKEPLMLNVIAGTSPNMFVINGTIAENIGIEVGSTYLLQVRETEKSEEYGRQFTHNKLEQVTGMDIIRAKNELGAPVIVHAMGKNAGKNEQKSSDKVFENTESEFEKQK